MRVYSLNRLENVRNNVAAILRRFQQLKPGKNARRKRSRSQHAVTKKLEKSKSRQSPEPAERSTSRNADLDQRAVLSKREGDEKGEQTTNADPTLKSEPGSPGSDDYTIPDETENAANKEGDESFIGEDSQLRDGPNTSQLEGRYEKSELAGSAVRKVGPTPLVPEPATAATERVLNNASQEVPEQPPQTERAQADNCTQSLPEKPLTTREEGADAVAIKTINDYEFDVRLITRFNKLDYKKTKVCRDSLKPVVASLAQGQCSSIEFGWSSSFKYSIFEEEVMEEIVPILMALKKIALTPIENTSLWIVLARRLVNMKVQRRIIDPAEIPSLFAQARDA